jgi:hypothetical protein
MAQHYIKFYPKDWLGDTKLQSCSLEEQGLWMIMLCVMNNADTYGHLIENGQPMGIERLAKLAKITKKTAEKLQKNLEKVGVFSRNSDGIIYSRRMVADYAKHSNDKKNGSLGGNPNLKKDNQGVNPTDKAIPDTRYQNINNTAFSDEKSISHPTEKKITYSEEFEKFWEAYGKPKNASKPNAQKEFVRLSKDDQKLAVSAIPQYKKSAGDYVKHPERYLKFRIFENFKSAEIVTLVRDPIVYLNYTEASLRLRIRRYLEGRLPWPDEFGWPPDDDRCDLPKDILLSEINSFKSSSVELTNQM